MINPGDTAFVLISAALVCLMTPGLAFFYGGLVRRKNVITIMMQNYISMGIVTIIWFLFGFSLAFGPDINGWIGNLDYTLLRNVGLAPHPPYGDTIPFISFFTFQQMFAIITPALITGAFADRVHFKGYLVFLVAWSVLVYIPVSHWMWGGGFLQQMGAVDFAGGIVVHTTAGVASLASVFVVGNRRISDEEESDPHNITYVALGTALLWFGWFGFNAGSALKANHMAGLAFINTDLAASVAMVTWLIINWVEDKKPSFLGALTGAVAGLATITPAAGYVEPWAAGVIGFLSAVVCYTAVKVIKWLNWDDALDVWGLHGVGGIMGSILVGVFASKDIDRFQGLIYGDAHQLKVQLFATALVGVYAFLVTFVTLKVINVFLPLRVEPHEEEIGLDTAIHGESAYNI
ncbi:MAG TPA: ammonium transporter [Bacillota bacterium]|nr:ammonium transporter [Bacillota bacterium]